MTDARRTGLQVRQRAAHGVIQVDIPMERYVPKRAFFVDYAEVYRGVDGIRLLFGKRDPFKPDGRLHYSLEVSFPYAQFCHQLYQSLLKPSEPGKPLFTESLEGALKKNGYSRITDLPAPAGAEKQGFARANAAMMVVFEDDTCVDFLHLDAMSLHLATKGKPIGEVGDVLRVVMAPNLLLYFVEKVRTIAEELIRETPSLGQEVPNDAP